MFWQKLMNSAACRNFGPELAYKETESNINRP